jgi:hypothetical protein
LDARDLVELGDVVLKFIPEGQLYRPTPEESRQLAALLGVDVEGPPPSTTERVGFVWKSMSKATRWGTFLLGLIVIVLLVFVVANRKLSLVAEPPASAIGSDPHVNTLKEAQTHFARSDLETAHRLLQSIPETSNVRLDPNFRLIEEKWALSLISKAETGPEDERQKLLETVSQTTTVDRATRNRAADLLAKLKAEAVDVAALPSMQSKTASAPEGSSASSGSPEVPTANAEVASDTTQSANNATLKRSLVTHNAGQSDVTMTKPVTTSSGQKGAASPPSTPNEPNAADLATSGNLDSARTARDALKRKVAAGTASEREKRLLRALCRQLGDNTCSR